MKELYSEYKAKGLIDENFPELTIQQLQRRLNLFLKSIYEKYVDTSIGHPRKFHYEQACIGYELQTNQMYTLIGNAWNFIYIHNQITKEPMNSYFVHLAGIRGSERENILTRHTSKRLIRWGIKK
jgi:hypothetical protein